MNKPAILSAPEAWVVVPVSGTVAMHEAWYRARNDIIGGYSVDKAPYEAILAARPDPTAWEDVVRYVGELEAENARHLAEIDRKSSMPGDYRYWEGRYRDEAARVKELEARLAEAEKVIEPFAARAGRCDRIWKDNETRWSPAYGNIAITVGHLRAAAAFKEGK